MAFSATLKRQSLVGNLKMEVWEVNFAGVTSGSFSAGLSVIDHVNFNNEVTEDPGKASKSGSVVSISGVTSNDTGTVLVIGY